jgi:hypothetical protein
MLMVWTPNPYASRPKGGATLGNQCFGHNGSSRGVNGDLEMCLDSSYTVVTLANVDPPAAEQVSQFIIGRLPLTQLPRLCAFKNYFE